MSITSFDLSTQNIIQFLWGHFEKCDNTSSIERCIVKGCLYYDTCAAYMCAAHVRRTSAMTVYTVAHVRCTCVTYRMFPTTHMFVVHVWAWPLDHSFSQSDVTGCVIQLLSGVWYIQKFNAQVTAKFPSVCLPVSYTHLTLPTKRIV